jgi:hypothetical protein
LLPAVGNRKTSNAKRQIAAVPNVRKERPSFRFSRTM